MQPYITQPMCHFFYHIFFKHLFGINFQRILIQIWSSYIQYMDSEAIIDWGCRKILSNMSFPLWCRMGVGFLQNGIEVNIIGEMQSILLKLFDEIYCIMVIFQIKLKFNKNGFKTRVFCCCTNVQFSHMRGFANEIFNVFSYM